jgi:protocatechuate 3,4-dioxygenase beta subunit
MRTSGGESVVDLGKYEVKNTTNGKTISITGVSYDPVTYAVILGIDTSDPDWQAGVLYNLTIKNIRNGCGSSQNNVIRSFSTQLGIMGQVRNNLDNRGIYGVLITLTGGSCSGACGTTTTDLNGNFTFTGFAPGNYTLVETDPAGFHSTSDSRGANDNQVTLTLPAGSNSTGNFFIDTPNTCSAPSVASTSPVNGATGVSLNTTTLTVHFNQPMITSGGGSVLSINNFNNNIHNLSLGGNVSILGVSYDPNTYTANLTIDSTASEWQAGSQYRLRIGNGLENPCGAKLGTNMDVLFTTAGFISGQVRNNADNHGIYGVTVTLIGGSCGGTCATTSTDANGDFTFVGFSPGSYSLVETDLPGYNSVSDSALPNDNAIPLTLSAGSNSAGNYFVDAPADCSVPGVSSSNPANGQVGVSLNTNTITVTFNRPMITYGGGSVLNIGNYDDRLANLSLGGDVPILSISYDPNTYTATLTIDASDTQWRPGSQYRLRVRSTIKSACNVSQSSNSDILFTTDLAISGQVRNDLNGNGNLSDLDPGIGSVTVRLYDTSSTLIATTSTNVGGFFTFDALSAGTYYVRETDPAGYVSTADSFGANDNQITVTLAAGVNSIGNKFLDTH